MVFRVSVAKPSSVYVRGACNRKVRASVGRTAWCVACGAGKRAAREGRSRRPQRPRHSRAVRSRPGWPRSSARVPTRDPAASAGSHTHRHTALHQGRFSYRRVWGGSRGRARRASRCVRRGYALYRSHARVTTYFLTRARSKKSQFHTCRTGGHMSSVGRVASGRDPRHATLQLSPRGAAAPHAMQGPTPSAHRP